jgi:hypothetical protein
MEDKLAGIDASALAILEVVPSALLALMANVPDETATEPRDDGWSTRDALGHLVDVEVDVIPVRIRRIIDEVRPFIRSIDAPARLEAGGYRGRTVVSLLAELAERRAANVGWLRTLPPEQLARAGDHDEAGEITVGDIAHQWAYHDLMHLNQIASMLQAGLVERMGNTRKFYDV